MRLQTWGLCIARWFVTVVVLLFSCSLGMCDEAKKKAFIASANQAICGPRCVQYVLNYYGHKESLSSLIRQMQWPNFSEGCSVGQIEEILQTKGVYTRSVQLEDAGSVLIESPAIVHLIKNNEENEDTAGHFVVLVPDSTVTEAVFWDGLLGMRCERWVQFSKRMSGVVVLTDDAPIKDVDAVMHLRTPHSAWPWTICVLVVMVLGSVLFFPCWLRLLCRFAKGSHSLLH